MAAREERCRCADGGEAGGGKTRLARSDAVVADSDCEEERDDCGRFRRELALDGEVVLLVLDEADGDSAPPPSQCGALADGIINEPLCAPPAVAVAPVAGELWVGCSRWRRGDIWA